MSYLRVSLNTAFQAHQLRPPMESAMEPGTMTEYCHTAAAKTDMSPERAIALKSMYIKLISYLYDLATSGAIPESEYKLQKDIILGQMSTL